MFIYPVTPGQNVECIIVLKIKANSFKYFNILSEIIALLILECYNSTFIGVILTLCGGAK